MSHKRDEPELVDVKVPDDVDQPESESEPVTSLGWISYVDPASGKRTRVTVEHYRTLNL